MLLSILAAVLSGTAYAIYMVQMFFGSSVPNPASWTVWAFLSVLNALTFYKGSQDGLATAQFFTGAVACIIVWLSALETGAKGLFSPLDAMGWTVLVFSIAACVVWYVKRNAVYANVMCGGILLVSAIPTIMGVLQNANVERALPWYLWTAAFIVTAINVARRKHGEPRWGLLMVTPVVGVFIHGVVALASR